MNDIDDLIKYIQANKNNFDRLEIEPSAPYDDMFVWLPSGDYDKLMNACPYLRPKDDENYNTDVDGHFDLNRTSLHVENNNGSDNK